MFDWIFTEPVFTVMIISFFLAPGISVLLLLWKNHLVVPGLKPRRWFGQLSVSVLLLCGMAFFLLSILFVFEHHRNALYGWLLIVVVGTLIMTIPGTFLAYRSASGVFIGMGGKIEPIKPHSEIGKNTKGNKI